MNKFIHIRSSKFPTLPGEREELVNDGMYGKALALYLKERLADRGFQVRSVCCEDWGWWVGLGDAPFELGVCIYSDGAESGDREFVCTDSTFGPCKWSWKKLRYVDTTPWVARLHEELQQIFQEDEGVELVGVTDEFPF